MFTLIYAFVPTVGIEWVIHTFQMTRQLRNYSKYLFVQVVCSERQNKCIIVLCYFFSTDLQKKKQTNKRNPVNPNLELKNQAQ